MPRSNWPPPIGSGGRSAVRYRLEILLALRDGTDQADLPLAAAVAVADYWNDIGDLTREGHLERRVVDEANCRLWWATIAPFVRKTRVEWGDPGIAENWEWLVRALTEAHLRTGREAVNYTAMLAEKLDGRISATQARLRSSSRCGPSSSRRPRPCRQRHRRPLRRLGGTRNATG